MKPTHKDCMYGITLKEAYNYQATLKTGRLGNQSQSQKKIRLRETSYYAFDWMRA